MKIMASSLFVFLLTPLAHTDTTGQRKPPAWFEKNIKKMEGYTSSLYHPPGPQRDKTPGCDSVSRHSIHSEGEYGSSSSIMMSASVSCSPLKKHWKKSRKSVTIRAEYGSGPFEEKDFDAPKRTVVTNTHDRSEKYTFVDYNLDGKVDAVEVEERIGDYEPLAQPFVLGKETIRFYRGPNANQFYRGLWLEGCPQVERKIPENEIGAFNVSAVCETSHFDAINATDPMVTELFALGDRLLAHSTSNKPNRVKYDSSDNLKKDIVKKVKETRVLAFDPGYRANWYKSRGIPVRPAVRSTPSDSVE